MGAVAVTVAAQVTVGSSGEQRQQRQSGKVEEKVREARESRKEPERRETVGPGVWKSARELHTHGCCQGLDQCQTQEL